MIGRSLGEYVFIRLAILGLRLITPLSITYLAASWYYGCALLSPWLVTYTALETFFYLLVVTPRRRVLQKVRVTCSYRAGKKATYRILVPMRRVCGL